MRRSTIPCAAAVLAALLLGSACKSHSEKLDTFRVAWGESRFADAEAALDARIAAEAGVEATVVSASDALDPTIDESKGDTYLLLLERAMIALAKGNAEAAVELLRRGRDQLDAHYKNDFLSYAKSMVLDDTLLDYTGADYENVMARVMLCLADLVLGGKDAYAYAIQIGEKQEEIIGSDFAADLGEDESYNPRAQYQRVAIGAYIQGLLGEGARSADTALVYGRARDYSGGDVQLVCDALARVEGGRYATPGNGVVHVFYLGGRGPHLEEGENVPTEIAVRIATVALALLNKDAGVLAQDLVPVPAVVAGSTGVAPLTVGVAGVASARTETLLDVNEVAEQQLAANMPYIAARAIVRRIIKGQVSAKVGEKSKIPFGSAIASLLTTATERADTRNWCSLPGEIQAARLELPEGQHALDLGAGTVQSVRVRAGQDAFVLVLRPDPQKPGTVLVDRYSTPIAVAP